MLNAAALVGFVATADMERAREFYSDTLGLALVDVSAFATSFDCGGTELRVTVVDRVQPAPYTVLGWAVDNVGETVAALVSRGVTMIRYEGMDQDADGIWIAPSGARIAWFRDGDDNILSVAQYS